MQDGQRILIQAIASGVGSAALQSAKWGGCWVAGTASRNPKLEIARQWGADAVYNYKQDDVEALLRRDTEQYGVDIGLMTIGEETSDTLLACMAIDGKVVMYGSTGGRRVCFELYIGDRNLSLLSMSISTSPRFLTDTMVQFREVALPLFADGTFRAPIGPVLPLSELARAHGMVDERNHFGKIILTAGDPPTQDSCVSPFPGTRASPPSSANGPKPLAGSAGVTAKTNVRLLLVPGKTFKGTKP